MISLNTTSLLINSITFILAYLVIATGSNVFRTVVADFCGDDTAKEEGFLTLNPLQHIDPIGLVSLVVFDFGWPLMVPINPSYIRAPYRNLKLFFVYFSDIIAHLVLSIIGIILLFFIFDHMIITMIEIMPYIKKSSSLFAGYLTVTTRMYPHIPLLQVVIGYICLVFVHLNIQLAFLYIFINSAYYMMAAYPDQFSLLLNRPFVLMGLFVLAIAVYFFSPMLQILVSAMIACSSTLARLFYIV